MTIAFRNQRIVAALAAFVSLFFSLGAAAENCIELTTTAEAEQTYTNEQGQQATRLVPVVKALPGDEVVWTVTAKNLCSKPAENVVIANPVPEHMTLVANTAMGIGAQITYSVDGTDFKPANALSVSDARGTRGARPEEIRHIRWSYGAAFAPGATAFVRYRAIVD